jgi:hypothetical protein
MLTTETTIDVSTLKRLKINVELHEYKLVMTEVYMMQAYLLHPAICEGLYKT